MTASNNTTTPEQEEEDSKGWSSYRVTVEPITAVVFFVSILSASPIQDLVMRQSCRMYGMDTTNCSSNEEIDDAVNRLSSTFSSIRLIIESLPGCIMSLFTGSWSETNGRKPFIIASVIGLTLNQFSLALLSTIQNLHPYWLLLCSIPVTLTGGSMLSLLGCFCYLVDVSSVKSRAIRFALVFETTLVMNIAGNMATPTLERMGFQVILGLNGVMLLIVAIYTIFFLPETVKVKKENRRSLFRVDHIVASYHTFFKHRPNHVRLIVFATTVIGAVEVLTMSGENNIKYLSLIKKFNWTISDYSKFNSVSMIFQAFTAISGVYVGVTLLKLSELNMIIIIQLMVSVGTFLLGVASSPEMYYIVSQIQCFRGCLAALIKGIQSKVIPDNELATIMSFSQSLEAFAPQLAAVIYGGFYDMCVGVYPLAYYFLSVIFSLFGLVWFIIAVMLYYRGIRGDEKKSRDLEKSDEKRQEVLNSQNLRTSS